jgi:hypothetical protein
MKLLEVHDQRFTKAYLYKNDIFALKKTFQEIYTKMLRLN